MTKTIFSKQEIMNMQASCACLRARGRARSLTQLYDHILAPSGLKITQFSLVSILLAEPSTIGELAEAVNIDRTTLTRALAPLERKGFIAINDGKDARMRIITLTDHGKSATLKALSLWKLAQAQYADGDAENNKENGE
jgi:DNA-binding MarR family transcriptional regulator